MRITRNNYKLRTDGNKMTNDNECHGVHNDEEAERNEYPNALAGKPAPIVSFFHFHQQANGRTYLVKPMRRSDFCDTPKCSFLVATSVETRTADEVLGMEPYVAGTADM